ncbi:MAG: DUF3027 domain-containing protein [Mycobacterium sp.]|nr:DUF3027 domain-containing protein [Mycobacterium sp.]
MTGPIVERPVATAEEWPEGLAGVLTGAVDQARAAVVEFSGPEAVGDYLGVGYADPTAATHRFLAHLPGYQGWQWAVVVAAYPGAERATISEVVLIPGPTALLAPEWVPWDRRMRPGDLSPGDLLAPAANDPRLVPGYTASGDPQVDDTAAEIGLGRRWVMSAWGRAEAAERWHEGDYGPDSPMARSTKRVCRDCGFYLPLAGLLGTMFGVCGNEMSADGHVVDQLYGCGAHSDTPAPAGSGSPMYDPFDDGVLDVMEKPSEPPAGSPGSRVGLSESPESPSEPPEIHPEIEPELPDSPDTRPEPPESPPEPVEPPD